LEACMRVREKGVYLITGGLGGLGLNLARYLAEITNVTLILISRSHLPLRQEWRDHIAQHGSADHASKVIEAIEAIEQTGSTVVVESADVADREQMRPIIEKIRGDFGELHGIFHLAGIASGRMMQIAKREEAEAVLRPKVQGTVVLDELCRSFHPDFFVAFSSLNALLGGIGQFHYCAANAFIDAYATANPARILSINWDAWRDLGMAADAAVPTGLDELWQKQMSTALSPAEGLSALEAALSSGLSNVAVSTRDLCQRMTERATLSISIDEEARSGQRRRPQQSVEYLPAADSLQHQIVEIWEALLGISPIGINDDFFELGGHSLLATQMIARLRTSLSTELGLISVFQFPTPALLAAHVLEQQLAAVGEAIGRDLLQKAQDLSEEEAKALLDSSRAKDDKGHGSNSTE